MKFLLFVLPLFFVLSAKAQNADSMAGDTTVYKESELTVKPDLNGKRENFYKFMASIARYPAVSRENNVQGKVVVSFIVEKDGSLTNFKIVKGVSAELNAETIRVYKLSPKWNPGVLNDKIVRSRVELPFTYWLNN